MSRLTEAPTLIASAQRALRLLEAAARHPSGATAKQLARDTGLALGTTYHLLRTLVHDRYLERREGRYRTGPAVSGLTGRPGPEGPAPGPDRTGPAGWTGCSAGSPTSCPRPSTSPGTRTARWTWSPRPPPPAPPPPTRGTSGPGRTPTRPGRPCWP
ncbi:helix-turn-helix domain-containing protein [Kitasatospora cineracea]|uniref:helix-turn-helix domain-containing protein n=1 Tax=Kitasatospora cineracea TaxID=88074 RepID=UPI003818DC59